MDVVPVSSLNLCYEFMIVSFIPIRKCVRINMKRVSLESKSIGAFVFSFMDFSYAHLCNEHTTRTLNALI